MTDRKSDEQEDHDAYLEFRAARHNRRLARDATSMTITGLRMHPEGNAEDGVVVTLTPSEAGRVMGSVRDVLSARLSPSTEIDA